MHETSSHMQPYSYNIYQYQTFLVFFFEKNVNNILYVHFL